MNPDKETKKIWNIVYPHEMTHPMIPTIVIEEQLVNDDYSAANVEIARIMKLK